MVRTNPHRLAEYLVSFSFCIQKAPDPERALRMFGALMASRMDARCKLTVCDDNLGALEQASELLRGLDVY